MTSTRPTGQQAKESAKVRPVATSAAPQANPYFDLALPSIALMERQGPLPGSGMLRQKNLLALQRTIGNSAIQRLVIQRDGETEDAPAETPVEETPTEEAATGAGEGVTEAATRTAFQAGVSTPIPADATIGEDSATLEVGGAAVTILPDNTSDNEDLAGGAVTTGGITAWGTPEAATTDGVITSIDADTAVTPTVSIRTTYGPGASAADESGYGRGTTEEDEAAGDTSLGFHEGSHGTTTLDYLRANPLPVFGGAVGNTAEEWQAAVDAYDTAMEEYGAALQAEQISTVDCVGDEATFCEEGGEGEEGHEH